MAPEDEIIDLSSDEEGGCFLVREDPTCERDAISEFISSNDCVAGSLLSDVVVIDELSAPPAVPAITKGSRDRDVLGCEDDEDDLQILDCDPEENATACAAGDGDDELKIVGEKGQIACRDFPHSRHLCANFPFSSTRHADHCNMCHCFVCDRPAPCAFWGNGSSHLNHCHANDKATLWKEQRQSFKQMRGLPAKSAWPPGQLQSPPPYLFSKTAQSAHPSLIRPGSAIKPPSWSSTKQRQQVHTSARVASQLNARGVSEPRYPAPIVGRPLTNLSPARQMSSRPRFKRPGHLHGNATNVRPDSLQAPAAGPRAAETQEILGFPVASTLPGHPEHLESVPLPSFQDLADLLRPCQPVDPCLPPQQTAKPTPRLQGQQNLLHDIHEKSWGDILANLASELGVPYDSSGTTAL